MAAVARGPWFDRLLRVVGTLAMSRAAGRPKMASSDAEDDALLLLDRRSCVFEDVSVGEACEKA